MIGDCPSSVTTFELPDGIQWRVVRIELFGVARVRAGTDAVEVEASTVEDSLRALAQVCPQLVPEVVNDGRLTDHFLASLNGELFVSDPGRTLRPEDTLLILGAQAGG